VSAERNERNNEVTDISEGGVLSCAAVTRQTSRIPMQRPRISGATQRVGELESLAVAKRTSVYVRLSQILEVGESYSYYWKLRPRQTRPRRARGAF
jgi:hypothetical protein